MPFRNIISRPLFGVVVLIIIIAVIISIAVSARGGDGDGGTDSNQVADTGPTEGAEEESEPTPTATAEVHSTETPGALTNTPPPPATTETGVSADAPTDAPATATPVPPPAPAPQPTTTSQPPAPPAPEVIQSCIAGAFEGWSGETLFELCNGQLWIQSSYAYTYHYAYRPAVTITRSNGGWEMSVEGVTSSIRVTQITDFIRTCISGTFEGWSGDTVFELCNGQVWVQSAYAYHYHYAYRPSVLIYRIGSGYRMQVEGVSQTVAVVMQ